MMSVSRDELGQARRLAPARVDLVGRRLDQRLSLMNARCVPLLAMKVTWSFEAAAGSATATSNASTAPRICNGSWLCSLRATADCVPAARAHVCS